MKSINILGPNAKLTRLPCRQGNIMSENKEVEDAPTESTCSQVGVERIVRADYEFLLNFWGEIEDHGIVEKELGILEKSFWFNDAINRGNFKKKLSNLADKHGVTIAFSEEEGTTVRLRTIAKLVYEFDGATYDFDYDFGFGYPASSAEYMFNEGNYACDCNVSSFIHDKYPAFPEMDKCGNEIVMKSLDVVLEA